MQQRRREFLTIAAGSAVLLAGCSDDGDESDGADDDGGGDGGADDGNSDGSDGGAEQAQPETILDERAEVQEDEAQSWRWQPDQEAELEVDLIVREGPAVDFYIMEDPEFDHYQAQERFEYASNVSLPNTEGETTTGTIPSGRYVLVLDNTNMGAAQPPSNFDDDVATVELTVTAQPV